VEEDACVEVARNYALRPAVGVGREAVAPACRGCVEVACGGGCVCRGLALATTLCAQQWGSATRLLRLCGSGRWSRGGVCVG